MGTTLNVPAALERSFFDREVLEVARDLIGRVVRHRTPAGVVAVRLSEVEAYAGQADPGSHAYRGRTPRTAVMFGPPGHAYVYFSYGMHWCMNLVCGPEGEASAVLLRAGAVVEGLELARSRRPAAKKDVDLARGPARLTQALGVDRALDGADVCSGGELEVLAGSPVADADVVWGPRVGVAGAGAPTPWRVSLVNDPTVSAYRVGGRRSPGTRST
ncbi:DNA-3-methyladenine glycosylase [Kineococcus sp. SYSU DK003]|uniref:DNA-3-methyladenine glycosylase n=1 Tax=Kineococcus sp. SYSU DK003 TaxID=3383124 RepID=UPI003D7E61DB